MVALPRGQSLFTFGKHRILGKCQMLADVADAVIAGNGDAAPVRMLLIHDDLEEGGFTVAVPAHQADPFTGVDFKACLFKEYLFAECLPEIFYTDHNIS